MAMTFDATLKDMARECPEGFLAAFDRVPSAPVSVLNVELSTVTAAADTVYGFARYHVPVHTVVVLLRPAAAHSNMNGQLDYAPRPERGSMSFRDQVERLWTRSAEELLSGDVGVAPLAVLGRLPEGVPFEEAIKVVAERIVERLTKEAPPDRAKKLLTDALLLTRLRVKRDIATKIFRGVGMMEESDTYLMIVDQGKEKEAKRAILLFGEERLGPADDSIKAELDNVSDLERLERMIRRAAKAATWREIVDTP